MKNLRWRRAYVKTTTSALDGLRVIAGLDEHEQDALERAMLEHFGACTCQVGQVLGTGRRVVVLLCARHRFLEEQDRNVSRLQRLVYVRRTREYWSQQEFDGVSG